MHNYLRSKVWWQIALIYALVAVLLGVGMLWRQRVIAIKVDDARTPIDTPSQSVQAGDDTPARIVIPAVNIDLVTEPGKYDREIQQWSESDTAALFATAESVPGIAQNTTLVYAHDRQGLFRGIHGLKGGDQIYIYTKSTTHTYEVSDEKGRVILPTDTSILSAPNGSDSQLILLTCEGFFSEKRFTIRATLRQE